MASGRPCPFATPLVERCALPCAAVTLQRRGGPGAEQAQHHVFVEPGMEATCAASHAWALPLRWFCSLGKS